MRRPKSDDFFVGSIEGAVQVLAERGWTRKRIVEVVDRALLRQREDAKVEST